MNGKECRNLDSQNQVIPIRSQVVPGMRDGDRMFYKLYNKSRISVVRFDTSQSHMTFVDRSLKEEWTGVT